MLLSFDHYIFEVPQKNVSVYFMREKLDVENQKITTQNTKFEDKGIWWSSCHAPTNFEKTHTKETCNKVIQANKSQWCTLFRPFGNHFES